MRRSVIAELPLHRVCASAYMSLRQRAFFIQPSNRKLRLPAGSASARPASLQPA